MPQVDKPKRSRLKPAPYPSTGPAAAGPSTVAVPKPAPSPQVLAKKARRQAKKALRQSLSKSGDLPTQAGEGSAAPALGIVPTSGRTDSAATTTTSDSTALPAAEEKKKRKKLGREARKREKALGQSPGKSAGAIAGPSAVAVDKVTASPHRQPAVANVASSDGAVAPAVYKSKKKKRDQAKLPAQPDQPSGSAQSKSAPASAEEADLKIAKLRKKLEKTRQAAGMAKVGWDKEKVEMAEKLKEAEGKLETHTAESSKTLEEKEEELTKNVKILETLREAATCGVCLDYFKDPHILACGHIACKACLTSWFRTPAAFLHRIAEVGDNLVPDTKDVSYRTKLCHVCRVPIFRRPSRMYHFDSILEPLGINPQIPSLSQDTREAADPWRNIFPREHDSYRVHDDDGHIERCPECNSEIMDNYCDGCNIEFSESEGEDEIMSEGSEIGGEDGDDVDGSEDDDEDEDGDGDVGLPWALVAGEDDVESQRRNLAAAEARADRLILAHARQMDAHRNLMDLDASSDGHGSGDEEEDMRGQGFGMGYDYGTEGEDEEGEEESMNGDEQMAALQRILTHGELMSEEDDEDEAGEDEASYDSSFIDDDAEEVEVERGTSEEGSGLDDHSLEMGEKVPGLEDTSVADEEEVVGIDEMRERRLARFNPPAPERVRSESPVIMRSQGGSTRRRTVVQSDSE